MTAWVKQKTSKKTNNKYAFKYLTEEKVQFYHKHYKPTYRKKKDK